MNNNNVHTSISSITEKNISNNINFNKIDTMDLFTQSVIPDVPAPVGLLGKKGRFSPFFEGEKVPSTPVVTGFVGSQKTQNLNVKYTRSGTDVEIKKQLSESDKYHSKLAQKYQNLNLARKILYTFEKRSIDSDSDFKHLTEHERKYKAMNTHTTIKCLRTKKKNVNNIGIRVDHAHDRAIFTGAINCSSPWACPICAAKIAIRRAEEIKKAFQWAYQGKKYQVMMLTLTFPHGISDDLGDMLAKLKLAMQYFRKGENYDKFKTSINYQGMIKAMELTWGMANGWHPHTHELQIIKHNIDEKEEKRIYKFILKQWEMACKKAGLLKYGYIGNFRKHAVHIIFNAKDSDYLAKMNHLEDLENEEIDTNTDEEVNAKINISHKGTWGADREIASATTKKAKLTGLSPWEILKQSDNNTKYQELFYEYATRMKGKKQIVWSRGLKAKVGIEDKTDTEIAEEYTSKTDLLALLTDMQWHTVLKVDKMTGKQDDRAYVQWLAVNVGFDGLAQYFAGHGLELLDVDSFNSQELINENERLMEKQRKKTVEREESKKTKKQKMIKNEIVVSGSVISKEKLIYGTMTVEQFLKYYDEKYG